MQRDLLSRLAAEAERLCSGLSVRDVLCRPGFGVALLMEGERPLALDVAPGPPRPRLAATGMRLRASTGAHEAVTGAFRKAIRGRKVVTIRLLEGERIARIDVAGEAALVLEVLGAASNLLWLAGGDRVVARFRNVARPGGDVVGGEPWRPPPRRDAMPVGDPVWREPAESAPARPGLATPFDTSQRDPLEPLGPDDVRLCVTGPPDGQAFFAGTERLGDAFLRREFLLEGHAAARRRLDDLHKRHRRAEQRLGRLEKALLAEEDSAGQAGALRRHAEALLAGLSVSRRSGAQVVVPDPYAPAGTPLTIPIDPTVSDSANADRLFRRAGRLERVRAQVEGKRERAAGRRARLQELGHALATATTVAALDGIETDLDKLAPQPRQERGAAAPARRSRREGDPRGRRIRRYELPGGWHVLVGGNGTDNDYLTFSVAAGHDFWLHAADYPGAHVVVRNPRRRSDLPPEALRWAAAVAAHFSKAPAGERVTVRWTQARHVRKGRGLPPGTVLLPRFSTLSVLPAVPRGTYPTT